MKRRLLSALLAFCLLAGFLPPQAAAVGESSPFTDVNPADWYYEGVEYVRQHNLMNGTEEGIFSPKLQMSRAMLVTVLHRLAGQPQAPAADFSDVTEGQWYSQAAAWAADKEIVAGYGDGRFGPEDPITRQQLAAILHRYARQTGRADLEKTADLSAFADRGQIGEYALEPMQWAVEAGLLTGVSASELAPAETATRGQIATILARFCKDQPASGQFTVTFYRNDGENQVYQTQQVEAGKAATKPADPTRSGFTFAGWHTAKEGNSPYDFASPVTGDLALYAVWTQAVSGGLGGGGGFGGGGSGSGSGSGSGGDSQSPYLYSITGVTVENGKAIVTVNTDKACSLRVRVLDDQGKEELDSASISAAAQLELENLQVPLNKPLPEFFRLEASLADSQGKDLCEKFLCVNYTSAYAEFAAATVDDFEGQIVLNFDEQPDENFGVLPKGAIQAEVAPQEGRAAADENTYLLDNADRRLDQAKAGDIVAVYNDQGEVETLIKIAQITLEGDQALVAADPDASLEDFYDLLKVDLTLDADESMVDLSEADEGVSLLPSQEEGPEGRIGGETDIKEKLNYELTHEKNDVKLTGTIDVTVKLDVALEWAPHLLSEDYLYAKIGASNTAVLSAKIEAHKSDSGALCLGFVDFHTPIPGLKFEIDLYAPYSWKIDGIAQVTSTIDMTYGAVYESTTGSHIIDKKNVDTTVDIDVSGEASIGLRPEVHANWLGEVLSASITAEVGLFVTASFEKHIQLRAAEDAIHACSICISGNLDSYGKMTVKLSWKITKKWSGTPIDKKLGAWRKTITPYYLSLVNESESPLGGKPVFGLGECPNQKYRTDFTVKDADGQTVNNASIAVDKNMRPVSDVTPGEPLYLYNGDYTVYAKVTGQSGNKDFKVNGKPQTVTVEMKKTATEPEKPDVPDKPDNPNLPKLATPTNLAWGKTSTGAPLPGSIYWEQADDARCLVRIFKEVTGSGGQQIAPTFEWTGHATGASEYGMWMNRIEESGSGSYYFTVQAKGNGETTGDSDIATSGKWTYIAPSEQLGAVIDPQLNGTTLTWKPSQDADKVYEYLVSTYYSSTVDGEKKLSGNKRGFRFENGTYSCDISPKDEGYYFFTIRAIPKDMTQYRSSQSEFLGPYHHVPDASAGPFSGALGENITWSYDSASKTLTINGTGEMGTGYQNRPWENFVEELQKVVIEDGITTVGEYAFQNCPQLTQVSFPSSIRSIGVHAFSHCEKLDNIVIPFGVTEIENYAFNYCTSLKDIKLPDSIKTFGGDVFSYCGKLTSISLPDSIVAMGPNVFAGSGLTSIHIPSKVQTINATAFYNCLDLTTVMLPDSVTHIGLMAFSGAKLKAVYYTGTEEQYQQIKIDSLNDELQYVNAILTGLVHFNSAF